MSKDKYDSLAGATKIISGQGELKETGYGAVRESNEGRGRFDLLPYEAIEALAKWYEAGSTKYPERNWEKGISVKDCINRMIRHSLKAGNGWTDEDHLAAVMWNAAAAITMMQRKPECNDHVWRMVDEEIREIPGGPDGDKPAFRLKDKSCRGCTYIGCGYGGDNYSICTICDEDDNGNMSRYKPVGNKEYK